MRFSVVEYDLGATLDSGQVFRWRERDGTWEGILGNQWFRLRQAGSDLEADTTAADPAWDRLRHFLRLDDDLAAIHATFPSDAPMRSAVAACPGLRLLNQDPWECLASFILSSTKQIVQIRQCTALLAERFGEPVTVPVGNPPMFTFPTAERLAGVEESALRACKLGFRARYLAGTAQMLTADPGQLDSIAQLPTAAAREALMEFPGVGRKIADCVLLFAYGRQDAFPVDVWVLRALRNLYFPNRNPGVRTLERFTATHFGPNAGYAQQYLFHYIRTHVGRERPGRDPRPPSRRRSANPSP